MTNVETTHYLIGSVVGPHPYPTMVRDFQSVIGREAKAQMLEREGRLPDYAVACVGGGSNAIGLFHEFLDDAVGAPDRRRGRRARHRDRAARRDPERRAAGVLHGSYSYLLQDATGQVIETHSISRRARLPRRRAGARLPQGQRARPLRVGDRRGGAGGVPDACASPRASSRRWSRRTPWPTSRSWRRSCGRTRSS